MVKLTYRLVKEFNAEAVCIISNQKLTQKVVYGMTSRGIPAFGAIWDSFQKTRRLPRPTPLQNSWTMLIIPGKLQVRMI